MQLYGIYKRVETFLIKVFIFKKVTTFLNGYIYVHDVQSTVGV